MRADDADYLLFGTEDLISRRLAQAGTWEPHVVHITRVLLAGVEQPLVLDIGANLGAYSVPVGKLLQPSGGIVHAFEAQRIVCYQLCGNVFLNRLDNVFPRHLAVGDADGDIDVPVPDYASLANVGGFSLAEDLRRLNGTQAAMTAAQERVPMCRLDSLAFSRRVSFIKIDVEGYELNVLRGARELLRTHGFPPIHFEAWSEDWFRQGKADLLAFVAGLGYRVDCVGTYDHLAQHPEHPALLQVLRDGNRIELRRVR